MKFIIVLTLLCSVALAQDTQPFDFDWRDVKDIWESPQLKPVVEHIKSRYDFNKTATGPTGRIVGGNIATAGQFPFHVFLLIDDRFVCGGSLINANYVLTAAHCLFERVRSDVFSVHDLTQGYFWAGASAEFIIHEQFDPYLIVNDIALIRLTTPAPNNAYTSYISLPTNHVGDSLVGYSATIQGFGVYSDAIGQLSEVKRYVGQNIMANANCFWGPFPTELCTDTTGGRGVCGGDSGGGLFLGDAANHSSSRVIVGIASFGSSVFGCEEDWPVVFTRVTSYLTWIGHHAGV